MSNITIHRYLISDRTKIRFLKGIKKFGGYGKKILCSDLADYLRMNTATMCKLYNEARYFGVSWKVDGDYITFFKVDPCTIPDDYNVVYG